MINISFSRNKRPLAVRFLGLSFLSVLGVYACSPSAQDYVERAQSALEEQDAKKALELYRNAFDVSLPDEFFIDDLDDTYTDLFVSLDGKTVLTVRNRGDRTKSYIAVYRPAGDIFESESLTGYIHSASISPNGHYAAFTVKNPELPECRLLSWNLDEWEKESYETSVDCQQRPGISSQGILLFMREGKIFAYDFGYHEIIENYIEKTPDPPIPGMPAWASFEFSIANIPFFTFGSAGSYKLYSLKNRKMSLLSKDASASRIYFYPGESYPGVITGGANNHQIRFYDPDHPGDLEKSYPVRYWKDALFFGRDYYYFVEDNRLYVSSKGDSEAMNIWARKIYSGTGGLIYVLTPPGHLIQLQNLDLPPESTRIFQLGWEL